MLLTQDLDELMHPAGRAAADQGARDSSFAGLNNSQPPPATDRLGARARQNGTVPFVLEEPIVPTQEMVPTGPRRQALRCKLILLAALVSTGHARSQFLAEMKK